jgi:hypothetical protein
MNQKSNIFPSKAHSITKNLNNSEEEKISNIEFQKIIRMTNEVKEVTQKLVFDLREDMNTQLNNSKRKQTNR